MLEGRLGLETARVPHIDRHGLVWLARGDLQVEDGTLKFVCTGGPDLGPGEYSIPYQMVSMILLGPGSRITHDALRILARHGTGLAAIGEGGVRMYTAPPLGQDDSTVARRQARLWADTETRQAIARKMFAWRFGEIVPDHGIEALRGMEGARLKTQYQAIADQYGIVWNGRRHDRGAPDASDLPNQAINHAAVAVKSAAAIAVAAVAAIPQLGFIHEDSSAAFILDIADLFRTTVTIPVAFKAVANMRSQPNQSLERLTRRGAEETFRTSKLIPTMIDRIKEVVDVTVRHRDN